MQGVQEHLGDTKHQLQCRISLYISLMIKKDAAKNTFSLQKVKRLHNLMLENSKRKTKRKT